MSGSYFGIGIVLKVPARDFQQALDGLLLLCHNPRYLRKQFRFDLAPHLGRLNH